MKFFSLSGLALLWLTSGPAFLTDGFSLERELRGGEIHGYPVELAAGQYLRVVVGQDGIDVVVRLLDPDGAEILAIDSPNGRHGNEDLAALAARSGPHRIEVVPSSTAPPGRYRLQVTGPRPADEADRLYARAVRIHQEAIHAWAAGQSCFARGEPECAAAHGQRAADLWRELGGGAQAEWLVALNTAGMANLLLSRWEVARGQFEEALVLARKLGDVKAQADVLSNLGRGHANSGDPRVGIELLQESIRLARKAEDNGRESTALINLGSALANLGERQAALESYQQALTLARQGGLLDLESTALNNLGDLYESLGDWDRALDHHGQALQLNRKIGNRAWEEAVLLNNLGVVHQRREQWGEAAAALEAALTLAQAIGDRRLQATFLTNLAFLDLRRGHFGSARERGWQALPLVGGLPSQEAEVRRALGWAHRELGDLAAARRELRQALSLSRERGDKNQEAEISLTLAHVERMAGDLPEALSLVEGAIKIIESMRTRVVSQELRTSYFATKQAFYELQVDILMAFHRTRPEGGFAADALRVSEQARARSLLEILGESRTDIRQGADPALIEREHRLRTEVGTRELRRLEIATAETVDPERLAAAQARLEEAIAALQEVQAGLREGSPRYAALTQPRPLDVREIREQVLDGEAVLLEYALGKERSYLWAVTPDSLASFELPPRQQIEDVARRWYGLLTTRNRRVQGEALAQTRQRLERADAEAAAAAAELSALILGPVSHLLGSRSLLVVADGALQYVPFAALPVPAGAAARDLPTVVSLPSASALAVLRQDIGGRKPAPKTLAVLADPIFQKDDPRLAKTSSLPAAGPEAGSLARGIGPGPGQDGELDLADFRRLVHSAGEADAIARLAAPDQTFKALGFAASRTTAMSGELRQYRNVHFATHGLLKSDHPELSGLVFSLFDERGAAQDGFLRLTDIYNLELDADLVVLSACRTALGKEVRGEGLIGLTRGFMYAGAARVLATLWSVEDRATAELMKRFYRAMLGSGLRPAEALRQAQLEMSREPRWKAPYYWAGFSLQGEWR